MVDDLSLTATKPGEMASNQLELIGWCGKKIDDLTRDAGELDAEIAIAKKNKWRTTTLKAHAKKARDRISYYQKIQSALEAGYVIVPPFPTSTFAIRTKKDAPSGYSVVTKHYSLERGPGYMHEQQAQPLPAGDGEYKNPLPVVAEYRDGQIAVVNNSSTQKWVTEAIDWRDIDFPINMAKPQIMEATSRAMALKIFDEFGILPDPSPKRDPMILATIIKPSTGYTTTRINFIIAWHINTKAI